MMGTIREKTMKRPRRPGCTQRQHHGKRSERSLALGSWVPNFSTIDEIELVMPDLSVVKTKHFVLFRCNRQKRVRAAIHSNKIFIP